MKSTKTKSILLLFKIKPKMSLNTGGVTRVLELGFQFSFLPVKIRKVARELFTAHKIHETTA